MQTAAKYLLLRPASQSGLTLCSPGRGHRHPCQHSGRSVAILSGDRRSYPMNRRAPMADREEGRESVASALTDRQVLPCSYFGPQG